MITQQSLRYVNQHIFVSTNNHINTHQQPPSKRMRLRLKSSFREGFDLFDPISGKEVKPKSRHSERIREAQVKKEMGQLRDEITRNQITIGNLFRKVERLDRQKQELKSQVSLLSSSDDKYIKMKASIAEEKQKASKAMNRQREAEREAQTARRAFKKKLREIQAKAKKDIEAAVAAAAASTNTTTANNGGLEKELASLKATESNEEETQSETTSLRQQLSETKKKHTTEMRKIREETKKASAAAARQDQKS